MMSRDLRTSFHNSKRKRNLLLMNRTLSVLHKFVIKKRHSRIRLKMQSVIGVRKMTIPMTKLHLKI